MLTEAERDELIAAVRLWQIRCHEATTERDALRVSLAAAREEYGRTRAEAEEAAAERDEARAEVERFCARLARGLADAESA